MFLADYCIDNLDLHRVTGCVPYGGNHFGNNWNTITQFDVFIVGFALCIDENR